LETKDPRMVSYTMEELKQLEPRWTFEHKLNFKQEGVQDRVPMTFKDSKENERLLLAPFGPPMLYCKMPSDIVDKINEWTDKEIEDLKTIDWASYLVGKTSQEFSVTREIMEEIHDFLNPCFLEFEKFRIDRQNKAHHPDVEVTVDYDAGWMVRSFAGDFNPLHLHTNCNVSCIGYTKLPDDMEKEWEEDYKDHYPCVAMTEFHHERGTWGHQGGFILKPSVGDFIIFPAELQHMVYPFRSEGERRSFSLNVSYKYALKKGADWEKVKQEAKESQENEDWGSGKKAYDITS
jgi:hypothetical protein